MKKILGTVLAITIVAVVMFGAVGSAYAMSDTGKGPGNGGGGKGTGDRLAIQDQIHLNDGTCDGSNSLLNDGICDGSGGNSLNDGTCDGTGDCVPNLYLGSNSGTRGHRGGMQK